MGSLTQSTKQAAKSGFQGIKKVRGLLTSLEPVSPPEGWNTDKMQAEAVLGDAAILEMAEGVEEFELKNNKFSCMWNTGLTKEQFDNNQASPKWAPWVCAAVASAEKLGKTPKDFVGTVVTLERQTVKQFSHRPNKDKDGKPIEKGDDGKYPLVDVTTDSFCFVADEGSNSENTKKYAQEILVGLGQKAAQRKLVTDPKLNQFPELKEKFANGTLAEYLELEVVDGKFQKSEA
jgi:hypothetical protein